MDPNKPPNPRTSGIPRPQSKLPVPRSSVAAPTSSLTQSRLRPHASVDTLRKKPSQSSLSKPTTSTTVRRQSGLPNSSNRAPSSTIRAPGRSEDDAVFKKPIGRPSSRQQIRSYNQRVASQPVKIRKEEDAQDVLGSLDGFRASSRQGFREEEPETFKTPEVPEQTATKPKKRQSLSERTIESLSQVPPSPAGRRRSNFFSPDTDAWPSSRPSSAMSNHGRPGTSDGSVSFSSSVSRAPATPTVPKRESMSFRGSMTAPNKRLSSTGLNKKPSQTLRQPWNSENTPSKPTAPPSSFRGRPSLTSSISKPKTQPRGSINGLFDGANDARPPPTKTSKVTTKASPKAQTSGSFSKASSSSAALREQIAKAKAARKATDVKQTIDSPINNSIADSGFDFGLGDDPFNQQPKGGEAVIRKRVDAARSDGKLNIAALGLSEIPEAVLDMYKYDANKSSSTSWAEVVELERFNAADNDIEEISDLVFPNVDPETVAFDDDSPDFPFAVIRHLDLRGNILKSVPLGLRWLQELTTLNLIPKLEDLKLAENDLQGTLSPSIGQMRELKSLDLQGNQLTDLPEEIRDLTNLRTLNVASNQLTSLDMASLEALPLVRLFASKNKLSGVLIPEAFSNSTLDTLNVSGNSLTRLTDAEKLDLPALQVLDVSTNRIDSFPNISSWTSLLSFAANENKLQTLPDGFTDLNRLQTADFTSNDISKIDDGIALMDGLNKFSIAANPLRERKLLTMDAGELKRTLRSRMAPADQVGGDADDAAEFGGADATNSAPGGWDLSPSGTLDLSSKDWTEIPEEEFSAFAADHNIKQLHLQGNKLESIPKSLGLASTITLLNLSNNNMTFLLDSELSMPHLRDLKLAGNKLTTSSIIDLRTYLSAPNLQTLDVTYNKLDGSFPLLTTAFPALFAISAADNAFTIADADSLSGLKMVDLSNNNIEKLDPRIGLLAGRLNSLNVEGNTFKVPNYQVLKKGTVSVLTWLRDRVPEEERAAFEEGLD